jgi:hypothetical protein
MKSALANALVISLLLTSCAKHPDTKITVKVSDGYSGYINLGACITGAQEPVVVNEDGEGVTSACPTGDVVITVIKPTKTFDIAAEHVRVGRRSDGSPLSISAKIP